MNLKWIADNDGADNLRNEVEENLDDKSEYEPAWLSDYLNHLIIFFPACFKLFQIVKRKSKKQDYSVKLKLSKFLMGKF